VAKRTRAIAILLPSRSLRTLAGGYDGTMALRQHSRKSVAKPRSRPSSGPLLLIAIFKLVKALLLIAVGIGALKFLHRDLSATVLHWTRVLRVDPDNRFIHAALAKLFHATPRQLRELSIGTFLYAGLFSIEGVGLLLRKRWAEYMTIVTTGGLIPLEVFELTRHFSTAKLVILFVNVAIVIYLAKRVRSR